MKINSNKAVYIILSGIFLLQLIFVFNSIDFYGGADNITHFRTARYAFKYPWLFLDQWGKPVYTTLVAPFALLSIQFARMFNVIAGLAAIFFTVKIVRLSGEKFNLLPVFFVAFSPMYFLLMQSCLTEILFSFVLVLSFWLFFSNRYLWAAIALSFIPFVRTEGIVIFPLFVIALILVKKYWAIPLLLVGSIFYTLVGYPHYHDWLWIIHQMPYSMGDSFYGSGSLSHFVEQSPYIFGWPFLVFLVIGLIVWTYKAVKPFRLTEKPFLLYFLIAGSFVGFFAAHSYVWWKGTGGSLGLIRVIASVIPMAAIIALVGFNALFTKIKNTTFQTVLVILIILLQVGMFFNKNHMPLKLERPQTLMLEASNYLKSLDKPSKIYYFDPYLIHFLNLDPYDTSLNNWGVADKQQPSTTMNMGDIMVWDAHFGPNEGGVQLDNLMKDPQLQHIKTFLPAENFQVLGGYDYGIYIFRKVEQKIFQDKSEKLTRELIFNDASGEHLIEIDGKKFYQLDAGLEYSQGIQIPLSQIKAQDYMEIVASVRYLPQEQFKDDEVLLVLSVDVDHKAVSYNRINLISGNNDSNDWQEISLPLRLTAGFQEGAIINLYVWNQKRKKLLLENIKLTINGF